MPNRQVKIDREALRANQFAILQNKKKMAQLSSEDLLAIAEMLEAETGYSTTRLKDKLRGYIQNKIDKTLKGEIAKDEGFEKLAHSRGTARQSETVRRREEKANNSTAKPLVLEVPSVEEPQVKEEKIVPPVTEAEIDLEDRKEAILRNKKEEHKKSLSANNFAILDSKKKMEALNSEDLCLLEETLKENMAKTKKNSRAANVLKRQYSILCSFAQNRIQKVLKGELAADNDFNTLVAKTGTVQQKNVVYHRQKAKEKAQEEVIIVTPTPTPVIEEPVVIVDDKPKAEPKPEPKPEKKEEKKKEPWYKRHLSKIAVGLAFVVVTSAAAVSGVFKKVFGGSEQNTKPVTEMTTTPQQNIQTETETQTRTADFQDVRSELQKLRDAKYNVRVQAFKESQTKLDINLDNLDKVVEKAVNEGKIQISGDLTPARAKYVIAFCAQYPGTEAGQACKALLNGEDVDLSNFNKWDKALGDDGSEFVKTLHKKTNFSPIDNASQQTKKDYQKANQEYNNFINHSR